MSADTVARITRLELDRLLQREGLERSLVKLHWSQALVAHLAELGFDPRYGARPLQRAIESSVVTPLARLLVERGPAGPSELRVDIGADGEVVFAVVSAST